MERTCWLEKCRPVLTTSVVVLLPSVNIEIGLKGTWHLSVKCSIFDNGQGGLEHYRSEGQGTSKSCSGVEADSIDMILRYTYRTNCAFAASSILVVSEAKKHRLMRCKELHLMQISLV